MSHKILFVLPVKGGGGGAHSVVQESDELIRCGCDVRIAVNSANAPRFLTTYADVPSACAAMDAYDSHSELAELMVGRDIVIATVYHSVEAIAGAAKLLDGSAPRFGYYVQDYEPMFFAPDDEERVAAFGSYTRLEGALLFAKTDWIRDMVTRNHSVRVEKVSPSIDTALYHPIARKTRGPLWVTAMVRPSSPRRAPRRTMSVLKELHETYGDRLRINIFGCDDRALVEHQLPHDFDHVNHGELQRPQVAALFKRSDVFMDLSDYQAFGRSGLEAMACGCEALLPVFGGAVEYAVDGVNAHLVDTRSRGDVIGRFAAIVEADEAQRRAVRSAAIRTAQRYSTRIAAWSEIEMFDRYLAA